jgi:hypothetical protein
MVGITCGLSAPYVAGQLEFALKALLSPAAPGRVESSYDTVSKLLNFSFTLFFVSMFFDHIDDVALLFRRPYRLI